MAAEFALPVSATFRALAWHVSSFTWHWMTGMLFDSTSLCYYPCSCHAHALEKYVYAPERRGQIRGSDCWCEPLSLALHPGVARYMAAFTADNSRFTEYH